MTYPLTVEPEAEADIAAAYAWYEAQRPGLGDEFLVAVERVFERISESPLIYRADQRALRRAMARRFPYAVYFRFRETTVQVVAVFHGRRDPSEAQAR